MNVAVAWKVGFGGLLLAGVGVMSFAQTTPAHACSVNPDYNPLIEADLVLSGYILGFEIARSADPGETRHPVDFGLQVDEVFVGDLPRFVTVRSYDPLWDDTFQNYTPRLCPGLAEWDVGRFVLLSVTRLEDGVLGAGVPLYIGSSPDDPMYQAVVANLDHPFRIDEIPGPPDAGSGVRGARAGLRLHLVGLVLALGGLGGMLATRRSTSG
jgi:hypothetical protein